MKQLICAIIILSSFLVSCEKSEQKSVGSDKVVEDNIIEVKNIETPDEVKEITCLMKDISENKDVANFVYTYDTMDNYGETTTIIPGIYNNTSTDISNFELEYNFIKDGSIVYNVTNVIENVVEGNGGFLGMPVFMAEIPITDFDSIEITMKK